MEKLLAQAGFKLAPSGYRSDALPIEPNGERRANSTNLQGASSNPAWANNFPVGLTA